MAPSAGIVSGPTASLEVVGIVTAACGLPITLRESQSPVTFATVVNETPHAKGYSAVLRSLARSCPTAKLLGKSVFEEGHVDSWVEFAMLELSAHTDDPPDLVLVKGALLRLDSALQTKTFLVGDALTLADISVACALLRYSKSKVLGVLQPNISRFLAMCLSQPAFKGSTASVPGGRGAGALAKGAAPAGALTGGAPPAAIDDANNALAAVLESVEMPDNAAVVKLAELGIASRTFAHAEAMTVEEQAAVVGSLPGALTRNLLLKDKKHGFFLVTAWEKRNTRDTKTLGNLLKLDGKTNLRLASAEVLAATLKVKQGCLSYLACMNDTDGSVKMAIDKSLVDGSFSQVNSHPLRNDRTTSVAPNDVMKFLQACGHEPIILDFGSADESAASPPPPSAKAAKATKPGSGEGRSRNCGVSSGGAGGDKRVKEQKGAGLKFKKEEQFDMWYPDVVEKSEMLSYGEISGCYILRPWGYAQWEHVQRWFDDQIKLLDVENCYFPLFVKKGQLEVEKDHVEGFSPEVAWVTKSGDSDLAEPIAIRPTSETIMYPEFKEWIKKGGYRVLPIRVNQWCNVVRWEFKYPTPFLRSREFLWQEGHTAHSSIEEANEMVYAILELYKQLYEQRLAVPVIKGVKTEAEKFPGGHFTTTVEAYVSGSGRAIQGATSHNLGQNFGKMFDIKFQDENGETRIPWQTSWGLTTRSIGVMVMTHADNKGLVLPPLVAPIQVVIVPIPHKSADADAMLSYCKEMEVALKRAGVRTKVDARTNYNPGWKYNHWELKGVPVRIEVGKNELEGRKAMLVLRYNSVKESVEMMSAGFAVTVQDRLTAVQNDMLERATVLRNSKLIVVKDRKDFVPALEDKCLVLTPFIDNEKDEDAVKEWSRAEALEGADEDERTATSMAAKTLCKPYLGQKGLPKLEDISGCKCFFTGKPAKAWVLWGRSY